MALNYKLGTAVMMRLGIFQFGINTAAYQSLERKAEWRWAAHEVFGKNPVLQNVGTGAETISLPGVIYPEWRGGLAQVDAMRAMAKTGQPLQMTDGKGNNFGQWVILSLSEKQSVFADAGVPRKIEFTLDIKFFDDPTGSLAQTVPGAVTPTINSVGVPPVSVGAFAQTVGLASSIISSAARINTMLRSAQLALQAATFPTSTHQNNALGAMTRSISAISSIVGSAQQSKSILAFNPSTPIAVSAAQTMGSRAQDGIIQTASSVNLLNATASNLGSTPAGTVQALNSAIMATNAANVLARQTANAAASITG